MKIKEIIKGYKLLFAILACAFPFIVSAQMDGMAHNTMSSTNSQMGNMAPAMNATKMDNMSSNMMNEANGPKVGSMAPDFTLKTLDDRAVRLDDLTAKGKVVLVVLRGWPGYQCPFCTRQAHDFVSHEGEFKADGVQVVMVYPGPSDDLKAHAADFLKDKSWPKDFLFVLDPDYSFTKAYGLRWDAPHETTYPSTFIIGKDGKVIFAHISKQHGDRVKADTVLKALQPTMPMM
jgi:thioredoxin-dependent peroxiredoxin